MGNWVGVGITGATEWGGAFDNGALASIIARLSHGVHTYFMILSGCESGCLNLSTSTRLPPPPPKPASSPQGADKRKA